MTTLGAVFLPQLPPERLPAVARAADAAGLEELWVWEDCFRESGIAAAAAVLGGTRRLHVGVGLLPAPLRNVALVAMEVATLERMFPGRTRFGVGHGVQEWMGQVGARAESPVTLLREHVDALRRLLAGERVTAAGRYVRLDAVALDWPPPVAPPVFVGGVGPRTLRLTGEVGDGTLLTCGTTPDGVRAAAGLVAQGRAGAGRTGPHPVVANVLCATGDGAAERLAGECARWGFDPGADVGVAGDAAAAAGAAARWAEAGATAVVLQPTADDPDPEGFVRWVAEEVRPLVG